MFLAWVVNWMRTVGVRHEFDLVHGPKTVRQTSSMQESKPLAKGHLGGTKALYGASFLHAEKLPKHSELAKSDREPATARAGSKGVNVLEVIEGAKGVILAES